MTSNSTLKGHKLLLLTPWQPSAEYVSELQRAHSDLKVVHHQLTSSTNSWTRTDPPEGLSDEDWRDVTVLLTYTFLPSKELAPNMKYIQLMSAGCNHLSDHPLFSEESIAFCTANGVHPPQIAEWVICTFLTFQHRIPQYLDAMRSKKWARDGTYDGIEDAVNLRVGIMGYGSIGRQVGRVAKALGMEVYAFTNHPRPTTESRRDESYTVPGLGDPEGNFPSKWFSGTSQENIDEFLSQDLDLLVLTLPLTARTKNMIAAPQFKLLARKRTFISNISRGAIVNTSDLIEALDKDLIRGSALDVTEPEPLPEESPLWGKENVIITPHVSGHSKHYNSRVAEILRHNLGRLSEGRPLLNKFDKKLGY